MRVSSGLSAVIEQQRYLLLELELLRNDSTTCHPDAGTNFTTCPICEVDSVKSADPWNAISKTANGVLHALKVLQLETESEDAKNTETNACSTCNQHKRFHRANTAPAVAPASKAYDDHSQSSTTTDPVDCALKSARDIVDDETPEPPKFQFASLFDRTSSHGRESSLAPPSRLYLNSARQSAPDVRVWAASVLEPVKARELIDQAETFKKEPLSDLEVDNKQSEDSSQSLNIDQVGCVTAQTTGEVGCEDSSISLSSSNPHSVNSEALLGGSFSMELDRNGETVDLMITEIEAAMLQDPVHDVASDEWSVKPMVGAMRFVPPILNTYANVPKLEPMMTPLQHETRKFATHPQSDAVRPPSGSGRPRKTGNHRIKSELTSNRVIVATTAHSINLPTPPNFHQHSPVQYTPIQEFSAPSLVPLQATRQGWGRPTTPNRQLNESAENEHPLPVPLVGRTPSPLLPRKKISSEPQTITWDSVYLPSKFSSEPPIKSASIRNKSHEKSALERHPSLNREVIRSDMDVPHFAQKQTHVIGHGTSHASSPLFPSNGQITPVAARLQHEPRQRMSTTDAPWPLKERPKYTPLSNSMVSRPASVPSTAREPVAPVTSSPLVQSNAGVIVGSYIPSGNNIFDTSDSTVPNVQRNHVPTTSFATAQKPVQPRFEFSRDNQINVQNFRSPMIPDMRSSHQTLSGKLSPIEPPMISRSINIPPPSNGARTPIAAFVSLEGCKAVPPGTPNPPHVNQDRGFIVEISPRFSAFGVFDGHGENGHVVSEFICNSFKKQIKVSFPPSTKSPLEDPYANYSDKKILHWLKSSFKKAHIALTQESGICCDFSGCTASVALRHNEAVFVAYVGDSKVAGFQFQGGRPVRVLETPEHNPAANGECARIRECGGRVSEIHFEHLNKTVSRIVEAGLGVSRSFGDLAARRYGLICIPEFVKFEFGSNSPVQRRRGTKYASGSRRRDEPDDDDANRGFSLMLVVASDGLWDTMKTREVLQFCSNYIRSKEALVQTLRHMSEVAWYRRFSAEGRSDDTTTIVALF